MNHARPHTGWVVATAISSVFLAAWTGMTGCSREPVQTLTIAYSNDLMGALYPCNCPGKAFGGLARRATFLEMVRDTTDNLLVVDAGDFFGSDVTFGKTKADVMVNSLVQMGYDAAVVGECDFGLGVDNLVRRVNEAGLPVLAANVYDAATQELLFSPSWKLDYPGGLSVGLIGVMGRKLALPPQVPKGALEITDPVDAVEREIAAFGGGVDVVVVLAHLPLQEARDLAEKVPQIDLIVCGHDGKELRKKGRYGNAFILQSPTEGSHAGVAFAVVGKKGGIRELTSSLTPLSAWFADQEEMTELIQSHGL